MNSMARVMKFKWRKNIEVDPPTYRMCMNRKELAAAQAAKSKADQELNNRIEQSRTDLIGYLENLPDYTSEELEKLKAENPSLYLMHERGTDKLLQSLFKETPGAVDALVSQDRGLNLPVKDLSEATRGLLLNAVRTDVPVKWEGDGPKEALSRDAAATKLQDGFVRLAVWPRDSVGQPAPRLCFLGRIEFYASDGQKGIYLEHLWVPDNPITKAETKAELDALERNVPLGKSWKDSQSERALAWQKNERTAEKILGFEPPAEHPDEPWLHHKVKVELEEDAYKLSSALASLAKASGYCVMSDSFASTRNGGLIAAGERELKDVLAGVSDSYGYNWERRNGILEFRKRDWFRLRSAQIPDEWIERWKANFKSRGTAVLSDISQMAALTSDQLHENVFREPVFAMSPEFCWTIQNSRAILRFYNCLTPTQRRLLPSMGVGLDELAPEQTSVALAAIDGRDSAQANPPRFWENQDERIRFVGEDQPSYQEGPAYGIRAVGKDGTIHHDWRIVLREYVEPPEVKPKKEEPKKPSEKSPGAK